MDVRAKCREEVHGFLLAEDLDFQKTAAALLVAEVHRGAREQFPARQPQAALQKVVYSRGLLPLAELVRLRAVKREPRDE